MELCKDCSYLVFVNDVADDVFFWRCEAAGVVGVCLADLFGCCPFATNHKNIYIP